MAITVGSSGDYEYVIETTYGTTPTAAQLQIPSDAFIRANLEVHREVKRHYSIASHNAVDTTYHTKAYTLTLEYEVQQMKTAGDQHLATTTMSYLATHRTSGDLSGITSYLDTNDAAYRLYGGLINKYSWDCSQDNAIHCTVEIQGIGLETGANLAALTNYSGQTSSAAIDETIDIFEGSAITRTGKWTDGIKSGNFTIDNQIERLFKAGSTEATSMKAKYVIGEGTALVYASDGGKAEVDDLLSGDEVAIVYCSGTTASKSHRFTFSNASYTDTPTVYETNMTGMTVDVKWGGEGVAFDAYSA